MAIAQLAKKGGRYTKNEQEKRRLEVFRLHFDYGYSARKISEMMNINRNTINSDISFCYSNLRTDYDKNGFDDWLNKQLLRLESQRVRLRKELDSDITLREKLQVEKMILELDSKITSLILKLETSKQSHIEFGVEFINHWMKEKGHEDRYMSRGSLYKIPEKTHDKIFKLLKNSQ